MHIGILAGFGGRTTPMTKLHRKLQLAHQRGFGAVYFYWEGLWGEHAGPEGGDFRRQGLRRRLRNCSASKSCPSESSSKVPATSFVS